MKYDEARIVCKFVLFATSEDTVADPAHPGLITNGTIGSTSGIVWIGGSPDEFIDICLIHVGSPRRMGNHIIDGCIDDFARFHLKQASCPNCS